MAKVKVYLRVAKTARGYRAIANTARANAQPLMAGGWEDKQLPTAIFAIVLHIPDEVFHRASKVLAEIGVPEEAIEVAAEVVKEEDAGE